jgi:hypothetical protein
MADVYGVKEGREVSSGFLGDDAISQGRGIPAPLVSNEPI